MPKPSEAPEAEAAEAEIAPEAVVEAAAVEQEPEQAPEAEAAEEPAGDAEEPEVNPIDEINASLIPMQHRDGNGACDRYEQDKAGNILVPASEAAFMLEHGFVVVDSDA